MKSITKISLAIVLPVMMLGATSCLNDEPLVDWDEIKDHYVIELADSDHAQYSNNAEQGDVAEFMIIVNYTASYASEVTDNIEVQLEVDLDTIAKINAGLAASAEPFQPFPASSYENLRLSSTIEAGTKRDTIYLEVEVDDQFEVGKSYILPLKIAGATDGYLISGNFNYLDLEINMAEPAINLKVPAAGDEKNPNIKEGVKPGDPLTFKVELAVDYPAIINEPLAVNLLSDLGRIAILNASLAEGETGYETLTSSTVANYFTVTPSIAVKEGEDPEFQPTSVTIEAGKMKYEIEVEVNTSAMQLGKKYVLPIEIDSVPEYYTTGSSSLLYLEVHMAAAETAE